MKKLISILFLVALMLWAIPCSASAAPKGDVWDGVTITAPSKLVQKDGVYYYEITKCAELAFVAQTGGEWLSRNYVLANDLILNDVKLTWDAEGNCTNTEKLNVWTPVGNKTTAFSGIFDGENHTISGVYVIKLEKPVVQPETGSSTIVSPPSGGGGGRISGNVDGKGLFGVCSNTIKNINVENSFVSGDDSVGGIVGGGYKVFDCSFNGVVKGSGSDVGGIIGGDYSYYSVPDSPPDPSENDPYKLFRICYCTNSGKVFGEENVSGISGGASSLYGCENKGSVTGKTNVAGIGGNGNVENSINSGAITGETNVAGISISSYIKNCSNQAPVSGTSYVGGISAKGRTVSTSSNSGNVSGQEYVGGISGQPGTVSDSYNTGTISGTNYVGGIMGAGSTAKNCYNIGKVTASSSPLVGAIIGSDNPIWGKSTITNCYYIKSSSLFGCGNVASSGLVDPIGLYPKTTDELKKNSTYDGWDFETTWSISANFNNGYPYLAWEHSIPLSGIKLSAPTAVVEEGESFFLSVSPDPEEAKIPSLIWSSNNQSVAIVDQNGKVTTVGPGQASIAVSGGGFSADCTITVTASTKAPYSLGNLSIRTESGSPLSAIPEDSFLVTIPVTKKMDKGDAMVLLATYTSDGQYRGLLYLQLEDMPVGSNMKATLLVENNSKDIKQLKAFVTSGFGSFTPLGEASVFPS